MYFYLIPKYGIVACPGQRILTAPSFPVTEYVVFEKDGASFTLDTSIVSVPLADACPSDT